MNMTTIINSESNKEQQSISSGFRVDVTRGERFGRVSSEWFSRPDDERYLSLTELFDAVKQRADRATARTVESRAVRVEASRDNAERLSLVIPGQEQPIAPTHWSFGQLCSLVSAPATYMRQLPAPLAGINLQHGLLCQTASKTDPRSASNFDPLCSARRSAFARAELVRVAQPGRTRMALAA